MEEFEEKLEKETELIEILSNNSGEEENPIAIESDSWMPTNPEKTNEELWVP